MENGLGLCLVKGEVTEEVIRTLYFKLWNLFL